MKQRAAFIFLIFFLISSFVTGVEKDEYLNLFQDLIIDLPAKTKTGNEVIFERFVKLNINSLLEKKDQKIADCLQVVKPELNLNLFDDTLINAYSNEIKENSSGSISWIGEAENYMKSSVILIIKGDKITGSIHIENRHFKISPLDNGVHRIAEIDQSGYAECAPPVPVYYEQSPDEKIGEDDGSEIDVLVAYTSSARTAAGSTTAMENLIDLAITESNTGYASSGVSQRLNLVHTVEYAYSEDSFNWSTTLSRLRGTTDGYMDGVHNLRDEYGADLVMLIVDNTTYCGLAYMMTSVSSGFESSAFSLVSRVCATGYYSFAHELGHNMGSHHDRANAGSSPAYSYSYGYQSPTETFRTIMAYNCPGGCTRVNFWSNPDINYGNEAMGVDYMLPLAADNRRSLNNTLATVRNFRQHVISTITVTSPVSGDVWTAGQNYNITWTSPSTASAAVKINIYKDSIDVLNFIEQLTGPNNGSLSWTIPASYVEGNYILRLKTDDGLLIDDSDLFAIAVNSTTPSVTVTSPTSSDSWLKGTTHNITWDMNGTLSVNVKINVYRNSIAVANFVEQLTGPNNGSYSWTIPGTYTAGNYILRLKTDDNLVYDDSDVFAVAENTTTPSITITSPTSSDTWDKGGTYNITWDMTGTLSANVKINVYRNSIAVANFVEQLTGPNNGSYSWTIPGTYTAGNYILRIKTDDNLVTDDSDVFAIAENSTTPSVTVTSPTSADTWDKGSTYNITWDRNGTLSANVKINVYIDSILVENFIEQLTGPNSGTYSWTVPGTYENGNYILRLKTDDNLVTDDSDVFQISDGGTPPPASITVVSPASCSAWPMDNTYTITWLKEGTQSANAVVNIYKDTIDVSNFIEQLTGPNSGSMIWSIPNSYENGNYIVRVKTDDDLVTGDSALFAVNSTVVDPPKITVTSPASCDTWQKLKTYKIAWSKAGTMSANVKINIYRDSFLVANFVQQLTGANTGSIDWTIPGTYVNGNYIIRIKTDDNAVIGDSSLFAVTD